ncbi:septal ring lytic transglycosylase RlpA family protein [Arenibaculum pallidiluteum]|uniref:septal ring lytic transglycosylase RlpA family protein n=1 Tax=Arenibaculum pallidiluteum TaxID=2812559 RepID=UPI001F413F02|nr:septal ring lytic transglycosylase RlpA family protein [Arenibaculum pallidiluteum]
MRSGKHVALVLAASASLLAGTAGLAAGERPKELKRQFVQRGEASYYADRFHGRRTAAGDRFNTNEQTAAHRTLPLGTEAEVTNIENGRKTEVQITDRGPHVRGRVIDLSKRAARQLGMTKDGTATVRIEADPQRQDGLYGREDTRKPKG